jgi:hypothetical protein
LCSIVPCAGGTSPDSGRRVKTQPLGSDYRLPVWVARAAVIVVAAAFVGCLYGMVKLAVEMPRAWPGMLRAGSGVLMMGFWAGVCWVVIRRARNLIRRQRDPGFQGRIRKFRALKNRDWNTVVEELLADPSVAFVGAHGVLMTKPFAEGGKQNVITQKEGNLVITAKDSDLLAEIVESEGMVGSVDFRLVVDER